MTIKISLVIGGAISLGSFQAGVIYELFALLRDLGENADYEVDVVTGASAGSVNSAVFALATLYDPKFIEYTKKIWLEGLDVSTLLEKTDKPWQSLFSIRVIEELKKSIVTDAGQPPSEALPAQFPDKVKVTMTLSNLTGIPYGMKFKNKPEDFKLTTFADWDTFELSKGDRSPEALKKIERMLDAAIASGSFPFAFPPRKVKRREEDFSKTALSPAPSGEYEFVYTDGGVFNNEPINRARELADTLDKEDTERIYLLVDPSPPAPEQSFEKLDMLSVGLRLIPAIFTEAHFRDWHHALKVNQRLQWQKELMKEVKTKFSQINSVDLNALGEAWFAVAKQIAAFKAPISGIQEDQYIADNLARVEKILLTEKIIEPQEEGSEIHVMLTRLFFVVECIGSLRGKKDLDIRLLTPDKPGILAGDFLANFGGFFAPAYRQHDFNIGRRVARSFSSKSKTDGGLGLDLSGLNLEDLPVDAALNGVTVKDAPEKHKIVLRDNILERADTIVEELCKKSGVKFWQRLAIPLAMLFTPWRWLLRKVTRTILTNLLNKQFGLK